MSERLLMRHLVYIVFVVLAACVSPTLVHCPDVDCPEGKLCDGQGGCASPQQLTACDGQQTGDMCTYLDPTGQPVDGECVNMVCEPVGCGNGVVTPEEACDDGNNVSGDGCSADCKSDETCGNSYVDVAVGEECDLGANNMDGGACESNCKLPRCGNGVLDTQLHEQCDDGANNSDLPGGHCRTDCQLSRCGDGVLDTAQGELCDDGNNISGDGCSADCKSLETCGNGYVDIVKGEQCDQGTQNSDAPDAPCRADCKFQRCGDGILDVMHGEACDAGALNSNTPGAPCRTNCVLPRCGDGVLDPGEVCDDGNNVSGDGCSGDCKSLETCGNSIIDLANGEQCDNGSANSNAPNAACRTNCHLQECGDAIVDNLLGELCDLGINNSNTPDAACRINCLPQRCGDGVIDTGHGEVCDDGNTTSGDGCSSDCKSLETCGNGYLDVVKGEQCDAGTMNANTANAPCRTNCVLPKCGDGIVDNITLGEVCDAGAMNSNLPNAACRTNCLPARCGDGIGDTLAGEVCDDGNTTSGDGCSADCKSTEVCGNSIVDTAKGEQCDMGTNNSNAPNAACRTNCQLQKCGDSIVDNLLGELCDLGASNSNLPNATCRTNCLPQRCGDSILDNTKGEVCDDGNTTSGDGCSADCKSNETCGNGYVDVVKGEQCDNGGLNSNAPNATCRTTCQRQECGDSIVDTAFGEACDLGASNSNSPNATCRTNCQPQRCGDGILDNTKGEVCDDGNNTSGDGCSADCKSNETCGNGIVDTAKGEQCDAGANNSNAPNAPCRTNCQLPKCGDGIIDTARGEICDAGAFNSMLPNAACRPTCVPPTCGDGVTDTTLGEVCDDGNTVSGDGCASNCKSNETCGNGVVDFVVGELCDDGNTRPYDGCSGCKPEIASAYTPGDAPTARDSEVLVYDGGRQRIVMFGGRSGSSSLDDTWEWDGVSWKVLIPTHTPSPRYDAGAAYDAIRHRVVVFGGTTTSGVVNDTWEWDGVDWKPFSPATSPTARAGAAMSFDANRGHVILFGGTDGTTANQETWEWTGTTWNPLAPATKPGARYGARMAFDSAATHDYVVMVGGSSGDTHTWTFDGTNWTDKGSTSGPSTGADANAMAFDANLGALVLWGGVASATYTWSGTAWTSNTSATPTARTNIVATYDAIRKQVMVFGGNSGGPLSDTWLRTGTAWAQPAAFGQPNARMRGAMGYDPLRHRIVLFGGQTVGLNRRDNAANIMSNDTWEWDGHKWASVSTTGTPSQRGGAYFDYDTTARQLRLYGGDAITQQGALLNQQVYTDVFSFNGSAYTNNSTTGRATARAAGMAYDVANNLLVTFSGATLDTACGNTCYAGTGTGDTWTWSTTAGWKQASGTMPPGRRNSAIAYDPVRKRTVAFAGITPPNGQSVSDTWEWNGSAWAAMNPSQAPPARSGFAIFYNPDTSTEVVFGSPIFGLSGGEDLWDWNGSVWTQRVLQSTIQTRYHRSTAYDAANHEVVTFGGRITDQTNTVVQGTMLIQLHPNATAESCTSAQVDYDNDGKAGCADDECWPQCTPLCPPALNAAGLCPSGAPKCGDGTCTPSFEDCNLCPTDCGACAGKCGDFHCDSGETHTSCPNDC
ncbi:MAG: DUF4215 domain-containing protein [Acidobacteriota bacterium]